MDEFDEEELVLSPLLVDSWIGGIFLCSLADDELDEDEGGWIEGERDGAGEAASVRLFFLLFPSF